MTSLFGMSEIMCFALLVSKDTNIEYGCKVPWQKQVNMFSSRLL